MLTKCYIGKIITCTKICIYISPVSPLRIRFLPWYFKFSLICTNHSVLYWSHYYLCWYLNSHSFDYCEEIRSYRDKVVLREPCASRTVVGLYDDSSCTNSFYDIPLFVSLHISISLYSRGLCDTIKSGCNIASVSKIKVRSMYF